MTAGPDGNLWFTSPGGQIGRITVKGKVTTFVLPGSVDAAVGITKGLDGNLWFTYASDDGKAFGIGHISPDGNTIVELPQPTDTSDASYEGVGELLTGPDRNLWFPNINSFGRITLNGDVTEFLLPTPSATENLFTTELIVGPGGNFWGTAVDVSGSSYAEVDRITLCGVITQFALPLPASLSNYFSGQLGRLLGTPLVGPDGNLWLTETEGDEAGGWASYIWRVTPKGKITGFSLPATEAEVDGISLSLLSGPDKNLWFTTGDTIGRITPGGKITQFALPVADGEPDELIVGPDHNLWFADNVGVGRMTPAGTISQFALPSEDTTSPENLVVGAYDLTAEADGNLWFFDGVGIGRITPAGTFTQFALPPAEITSLDGTMPGPFIDGPDHNLWFTDATGIGRITPAGFIAQFPLSTGAASQSDGPGDLIAGPDGNLWFLSATAVGRITPSGKVTLFPLQAESASVSPGGLSVGPDHNLWFSDGVDIERFTTGA